MTRLAKQLPEYDVVRSMYGVGDTTAAQLMAEIGDIRNFKTRRSIVAFAGIDPAIDQSGKEDGKGKPSTKRGSPHLRKTLFQIMSTYVKVKPADEPIYQFLEKKKAEGKPYSNPTNQQDTKQDLNQPIQSEGATAEKAVSMASGKA